MSNTIEVKLPDIGDFEQVEVIEVLVKPGDRIEAEESLITLESDKATMEIPSPRAGKVRELLVKVGDRISQGAPILMLEPSEPAQIRPTPSKAPVSEAVRGNADLQTDLLVLGGGPGGYTAAFRAADLGKRVVLVERYADLGGVCLNVGCIPSKALLHAADVINEAREMAAMGVSFGPPKVDIEQLRASKERVVRRLTGGLAQLAKQRKVERVTGFGRFESPNRLAVEGTEGSLSIAFTDAIIACGSSAVKIPGFPNDDPRLIDSTGALALQDVPKRMLILGGGIIGLEMATVYATLGSEIDIVELQENLIPGCDPDLVRPLYKRIKKHYRQIMLSTKVTDIQAQKQGLKVSFEGKQAPDKPQLYDRVLVAVGRSPNGRWINAEAAGVEVDERGFIPVDAHMRTNVPNIYAIGDVVG